MKAVSSPAACVHPSNLLTYLSLVCAVCALAAGLHGRAGVAGACVALAALCDTFDGRFARLFARTDTRRAFGAQFDSLADVAAFGVVPALCLVLLSRPSSIGSELLTWLATFLYVTSAATRLGFYNLQPESAGGFVGLPVPAAALVCSTALLAGSSPLGATAILVVLSVAMIAPLRIPRPTGAGLAIFALWPVLLIAAHLLVVSR